MEEANDFDEMTPYERGVFEALGAPFAAVGDIDAAALGRTLVGVGLRSLANPQALFKAATRWGSAQVAIGQAALATAAGREVKPPQPVNPRDKRFAHDAWSTNPVFFGLQQSYLATSQLISDVLNAARPDGTASPKEALATSLLSDAIAPTNSLFTNPEALDRLVETSGRSSIDGLKNLLHDLRTNDGYPAQVDATPFRVGENLARTPGKVVYRNRIMELIQYSPATDTTYEIPLLFCPPWINKYYILDLAPGRSLIELAVNEGHTCFAISYRNPDWSCRHVDLEDYMLEGPLEAARVVRQITGAPRVNTVSVCMGATLTTMAMAYEAATGAGDLGAATLLNSHIDFSEPGVLGAFTDPDTVEGLARKMQAKGYLEAKEMAHIFDLLRANDLIFQYVVKGWILGESPPAFDLLSWNADSTRMPGRAHTTYLRSCYVENAFANKELELAGHLLDAGAIVGDVLVVAAEGDHIVPWTSGYTGARLLSGDTSFILSNAGHIAGIVNPPSPKARYWENPDLSLDADAWRAGATEHEDTWWRAWVDWAAARAGARKAPPPMGSDEHPVIEDAPGRYVFD